MQRVPVARPVAQQQRRRPRLAGGVAPVEPRRRARRATAPAGRARSAQSRAIGSRCGQNAARSSVDDVGQRMVRSSGTGPRRSGGGPCRSSSGTGRRRRTASASSAHSSASSTRAGDGTADVVELGARSSAQSSAVDRRCHAGLHASSDRLASAPPRYWPIEPSLRTTRWHGTTTGTGLWRTPCRRPAPRRRARRPGRRRRSSRWSRRGWPAGARARRGGSRGPAAGRRARRTCGGARRSTRRAGGRRRRAAAGPRRIRGLIAAARSSSTASWSSHVEGDAHQAVRRGRQQQRAERAVDGAVGDVEQPVAGGRVGRRASACSRSRRRHDRRAADSRSANGRHWRDPVTSRPRARRAQLGDAVGGAAAGRGLAAAEQRGDLGVGQVGEVVVDDGAALLGRQRVERRRAASSSSSAASDRVVAASGRSRRRAAPGVPRRAAGRSPCGGRSSPASRDVAVRPQPRVGPQRRQERLRPGVVGVGRPEQGPAHPHHHRRRARHDLLERSHHQMMPTPAHDPPGRSRGP